MAITLRWLIHESKLDNLRCVACAEKLNTPVISVNILDNPDVVKWIKANEIVLTTGYIFKDSPERQRKIVQDLAGTGCAALGIKIKRFFKSIPPVMIEEAERAGLPLIEIPFFYSFSDISKTVFNRLYLEETMDVQREQRFIADLSDLFFGQGTVFEMLYRLSDYLGTSVVLLDNDFICTDLVLAGEPAAHYSRGLRFPVEDALHKIRLPEDRGYLCIPSGKELPDGTGTALLEKAAVILGMALSRSGSTSLSASGALFDKNRYFMDFLERENPVSAEEAIHICKLAGFDHKKKRICMNVSLKNPVSKAEIDMLIKRLRDYVETACSRMETGIERFYCQSGKALCIFFLADNTLENPDLQQLALECMTGLKQYLKQNGDADYSIGIGGCHSHIERIRTAYKESLDATAINDLLGQRKEVAVYTKLVHYQFLMKSRGAELKDLYLNHVEYLERYDKENNTELLPTLKEYFRYMFNASDTAKNMYLHRNTLLRRLEKIRELLRIDFDDMEELFAIYLEICAARIME